MITFTEISRHIYSVGDQHIWYRTIHKHINTNQKKINYLCPGHGLLLRRDERLLKVGYSLPASHDRQSSKLVKHAQEFGV
jgi:hypothetical protein